MHLNRLISIYFQLSSGSTHVGGNAGLVCISIPLFGHIQMLVGDTPIQFLGKQNFLFAIDIDIALTQLYNHGG